MSNEYNVEFKDLPRKSIEEDPNQPRTDLNTDEGRGRLFISVKALGIQQPIAVVAMPDGKFRIIDGHRRFRCAKELGLEKVPCCIYTNLDEGNLERVRFEIQNNRRQWKPHERAVALSRIKKTNDNPTNKDLAKLLFVSETMISNSLNLEKQKDEYKALMEEKDLPDSYRIEFMKMLPKLKAIREFTVKDIACDILDRCGRGVGSAKDIRTIGRVFLRVTANQNHIYDFLKDPDMPVKLLELNTIQSGFSLLIEQVMKKIQTNEKQNIPFSQQDKAFMAELKKHLDQVLK